METDTALLVALVVLVSILFLMMCDLHYKVRIIYLTTECPTLDSSQPVEFRSFLPNQ